MARAKKKNVGTYTYNTIPALFTAICDSIRSKDGTSVLINHQDIPAKIGAIPVGATKIRSTLHQGTNAYVWDAMPPYTSDGGKLYIVATAFRDTAYPIVVKKNGTIVSHTLRWYNNGNTIGYWEFDTVDGDIISFDNDPHWEVGYDRMLCVIIK